MKILDDVKQRREIELKNIDKSIDDIKTKTLPLLTKKIESQEKTLKDFQEQVKLITNNLRKISSSNPSLSALKLMEKRDITSFIIDLNLKIMDMKDKKEMMESNSIAKLEEQKLLIQALMLPHNYKNTDIIGKVLTDDYPVKPKKILIVIVAFVTGLILSIFLVFFLEFINGMKNEEEDIK
jgi:capsular polysaccharide biosynthesis protein